MKLLREVTRVISILGISFAIYKNDWRLGIIFTAVFIFFMYVWPLAVIGIYRKMKGPKSSLGYDGYLTVNAPKEGEDGAFALHIDLSPEELAQKDDISLLIKTQ